MTSDTENWMGNLSAAAKAKPIVQLAIPGSHDSGTYAMTATSDFAPDLDPTLQQLEVLGDFLKGIMYKWSRTQEATVTQQLSYGIRYFDLRVAPKDDDPNFYLIHGLYAAELSQFFKDLSDFLDSHSGEIVILDFNHFYSFSDSTHTELINLIIATLGPKLLPVSSLSGITLNYMTSKNYQIIVSYGGTINTGTTLMWKPSNFPSPWADTMDVDTLIQFLEDNLPSRDNSVAYISQCILTPEAATIISNLTGNIKDVCFLPLENAKYEWIKKQKLGAGGINIIISDFTEYNDGAFPKAVIALNDN